MLMLGASRMSAAIVAKGLPRASSTAIAAKGACAPLRRASSRFVGTSTICVHAGAQPDGGGSMVTPIYTSVATKWPNPKSQHIYPRYNTGPNLEVVAARIAALEGGEKGAVFSSGMAAISSVLFTFLEAGDHAIMSEVYGATFELGSKDFPKRGIENTFVLSRRLEDFEAAVRPNTRLLYLETPSNPLISVLDIEAVISMARAKCGPGLVVAVDNTFATPVNTKCAPPLLAARPGIPADAGAQRGPAASRSPSDGHPCPPTTAPAPPQPAAPWR